MQATSPGARGSAIRSWSSTSSRERRDRVPGAALDLGRPGAVAEDEGVRRRSVDRGRASRPSRPGGRASPGPRRRAASPASRALDDELLGRAGEEVGDDGVDGDPPAGDRDPGLPGRARRRTRARAAAPRGRARATTVFFPIAQSEPTVSTIFASTSRFAPVGTFRPAGGLRRSRSSTPCRSRELGQLGIVRDELVQAVLDVEAGWRCSSSAARARPAGTDRPASRRRRGRPSGRSGARRRRSPTIGMPSCVSPRAPSRGSRRPGPAP